jgi:hypothetical protein
MHLHPLCDSRRRAEKSFDRVADSSGTDRSKQSLSDMLPAIGFVRGTRIRKGVSVLRLSQILIALGKLKNLLERILVEWFSFISGSYRLQPRPNDPGE